MGSVPSAAYDPIFFLHHANIDRLWAAWQATHPGSMPAAEASFQLQPFPRPYNLAWQTGSDVESTDALGYRYRRFCFRVPPIKVWEVVQIEWPFPRRALVDEVRVVLKSHHMQPDPVEIRAFVNQPDANARTPIAGNPAFAGAVAFFGHGEADPHGTKRPAPAPAAEGGHDGHDGHGMPRPAPQPGVQERFDLELNITRALASQKDDATDVALKLVAVDRAGRDVPADRLLLEEVVVEFE